jgi:hypothetical protein
MQPGARRGSRFGAALVGGISVAAVTAARSGPVFDDGQRPLVNAQNEPQNCS